MQMRIVDGVAVFPVLLFGCAGVPKNIPQSTEIDGMTIVCYSVDEVRAIRKRLTQSGVKYTEHTPTNDDATIQKTKGIKYVSNTEALNHINKDVEPESQAIPNLKKVLAEKDKVIKSLTDKYDSLEAKLKLNKIL
ncbi:MAG: hypothetical protein PHR07_04460 [Acidaminococcaceae bacterium]|nr:hypothetical protein [Acidaminococcaceae bacterium]